MKLKQNSILLIEPPFYSLFKDTYSIDRYPLSLGYLAGTIKKETNWNVLVYNADFHPQSESMSVSYMATTGFSNYLRNLNDLGVPVWKEIKATISDYKPSVVGITAKSQNFKSASVIANIVKEISPQIIVVVGGAHSSMIGKDILNGTNFDISVVGEGEETIVELLNAIETGNEFDGISGIIYRKNGQIVENVPRAFLNDIDSLCFPHESAPKVLKDYNQYPLSAFRNILAIRGCPYNCLFCGSYKIWSRKVRFRSPENVIKEIEGLQGRGLRLVHFDDDTFGVNKKHINDLCNAILKHCPRLKWSCELPVKLVDENTVSLMKASGCYSIQVGIESGNNQILREMKKNITIEEALSACDIIDKYGIELTTFFIVGFPLETEETLKDTVAAMKKIKCSSLIYSIFTPYLGTESYDLCREKGLISDDYDVSLYNHQSPANCFCINITQKRFRDLVSGIEKMVVRKNQLNRIKRVFSLSTFRKIQELGIGRSFQKGLRVFIQ